MLTIVGVRWYRNINTIPVILMQIYIQIGDDAMTSFYLSMN